tara:strand:+ start:1351 stop:2010 length:660 start_codon:yes stop_codon:yes gene_type:complete
MKTVKLSQLKQFGGNPRVGNVDLIAESLKENGQFRPLIVNKDNTILAGNHTFLAMKQLGWKECDVHYIDVDKTQAKKIVLVDNRLNDIAGYDTQVMIDMLEEMLDKGQLIGTGFDADAVDDLAAEYDEVSITDFETFQGGYALSEQEIKEIAEKKLSSTGRNEGKALKDIPISLLDKQYKEFKGMILKITQAKGLSTTEAILFCLEYAVKKNKRSWFNR